MDSIAGTTTIGYDDFNRVTSVSSPQGSVSYTYDAVGRRQTMTVAGQPEVDYTYDSGNRVTQIAQGSSVVQIGYDADGRRTSLTLPNGVVASYTYDAASLLTGITYTNGGAVLGDLAYTYDSAGRVATVGGSLAHTNLPPAVASASYNADNQLTQWGGTAMTYDPNGNLTNDGAHTYTWNPRNLLASIDGGNTASFVYGPFGRRVSKTVFGTTTGYFYDGLNVVQEVSGGTPSANLLTGGLDEVFTRTDSSGTLDFLRDGLGSTAALTDSTGAVQQTYTYDPYGATSTSGGSTNSYQYTGRENDATGLYYYRARYYNPNTGRFVSEDPIGFAGSGPNLYAYVDDDPLDFIDPFGLDKKGPFPPKHCLRQTLEQNWVSLTLDVTSLTIDAADPASQYLKLALNPYLTSGLGLAVSGTAASHSAYRGDTTGALLGMASHLTDLTKLSTTGMNLSWAELIPEGGTVLDLISTTRDITETVHDYYECQAN